MMPRDTDTGTGPDLNGFYDPELKRAVRRAWGTERAPAGLRQRMAHLAAAGGPQRRIMTPDFVAPAALTVVWQRPWPSYAAAAVLLLGITSLAVYPYARDLSTRPPAATLSNPTLTLARLPQPVADELVNTHERCCNATDHHHLPPAAAPRNNFAAMTKHLEAELGQPVVAVPLGDGWTFRGASVCRVGSSRAAHLIFAQDNGPVVSLFSLPSTTCAGLRGDVESESAGHPIAGFVRGRALYCVVASGPGTPATAADVRSLRDRVRAQTSALASAAESQSSAAPAQPARRPALAAHHLP